MKFEVQYAPRYAVIRLAGDFESYAIGEFLETIQEVRDEGKSRVILNMRRVKFINSTAIGAVLRARKELKAAGGGLALARSSAFVREIFGKLGLDTVLPQFEEEEDAAEALRQDAQQPTEAVPPGSEDAALFFRFYEQDKADMLGGRGVGAGEIVLLDTKGLSFDWDGRGHRFDDDQLQSMFATGTEVELKFRLPLYKKATYFETSARVDSLETIDGRARVITTFAGLDDEATAAVRQYVSDMALVREELDQAKRNG